MTSCRTILRRTAALAFIAALMPQAAQANSMLSGYGGPGQGSQAILGSTLVNAPAGGGSGGGGLASNAPASESSANLAVGTSTPRGSARGASSGGSHARHGVNQSAAQRFNRYAIPPAGEIRATSDTLGLSGTDFLYAGLVLCLLALGGALTYRLARSPHGETSKR
jgi:hypothetical protein